jgi:hypothetical protein
MSNVNKRKHALISIDARRFGKTPRKTGAIYTVARWPDFR